MNAYPCAFHAHRPFLLAKAPRAHSLRTAGPLQVESMARVEAQNGGMHHPSKFSYACGGLDQPQQPPIGLRARNSDDPAMYESCARRLEVGATRAAKTETHTPI